MPYLVLAHDFTDPDALTRRMAARAGHLSLADEMRGRRELLYAVALLNDGGHMCGSLMVLNLPSREAVESYLAGEPYIRDRVWEKWTVQECRPGPAFMPS